MPGNRRTVRASVCVARAFEPSGAGFGNDEEGGAEGWVMVMMVQKDLQKIISF